MTTPLPWVYDDGGRSEVFKGTAGDCVTRALAIGEAIPYLDAYNALWSLGGKTPRDGVPRKVYQTLLTLWGWQWVPTMAIGSGTTVHLATGELPPGRLITRLSRHLAAVIDGVVYDTEDPTRDGTRAVYGYFRKEDSYGN